MSFQSLLPQGNSSVNEKDFDSLIQQNLPSWSATWKMLLQANLESSKVARRHGKRDWSDICERIQQKITELVNEEEALIDLYGKAAEAAKKREITFKNKTAILTEQIKQDKNLMKMFRNIP